MPRKSEREKRVCRGQNDAHYKCYENVYSEMERTRKVFNLKIRHVRHLLCAARDTFILRIMLFYHHSRSHRTNDDDVDEGPATMTV